MQRRQFLDSLLGAAGLLLDGTPHTTEAVPPLKTIANCPSIADGASLVPAILYLLAPGANVHAKMTMATPYLTWRGNQHFFRNLTIGTVVV